MVTALQATAVIFAVAGMIYLQYRRAKWMSDRKSQKADVQTLFSGRK
jgi:hypothetical protein